MRVHTSSQWFGYLPGLPPCGRAPSLARASRVPHPGTNLTVGPREVAQYVKGSGVLRPAHLETERQCFLLEFKRRVPRAHLGIQISERLHRFERVRVLRAI